MGSRIRKRELSNVSKGKRRPTVQQDAWRVLETCRRKIAVTKDIAGTWPGPLVSEVLRLTRELPSRDVVAAWTKELRKKALPEFVLALAWSSPGLITAMAPARAASIYRLLGRTLRKVPSQYEGIAVQAMVRAVLRVRGPVPPIARSLIREHKDVLIKHDAWVLLGSFAA